MRAPSASGSSASSIRREGFAASILRPPEWWSVSLRTLREPQPVRSRRWSFRFPCIPDGSAPAASTRRPSSHARSRARPVPDTPREASIACATRRVRPVSIAGLDAATWRERFDAGVGCPRPSGWWTTWSPPGPRSPSAHGSCAAPVPAGSWPSAWLAHPRAGRPKIASRPPTSAAVAQVPQQEVDRAL